MMDLLHGRNPFVNQVSFFLAITVLMTQIKPSQSLRKSGQFLYQKSSWKRDTVNRVAIPS